MGPVTIELSKQYFTGTSYVWYPIDNGTFATNLTTVPGQFLSANVAPVSLVTYAVTTYIVSIAILDPIPQGGYILIAMPKELSLMGGSPICT